MMQTLVRQGTIIRTQEELVVALLLGDELARAPARTRLVSDRSSTSGTRTNRIALALPRAKAIPLSHFGKLPVRLQGATYNRVKGLLAALADCYMFWPYTKISHPPSM